MKEMKRKILSALLAVSLFVGAAIPAFAADTDETTAEVSTTDALTSALANDKVRTINLSGEIKVPEAGFFIDTGTTGERNVTINGNGTAKIIDERSKGDTATAKNAFIIGPVSASTATLRTTAVTLKELTLETAASNDKTAGNVLEIYMATAILENVKVIANGNGAAIINNAADTTVKGTLTLECGEKSWGGINMDNGTGVEAQPNKLTFAENAEFDFTGSGKAPIYFDTETDGKLTNYDNKNQLTIKSSSDQIKLTGLDKDGHPFADKDKKTAYKGWCFPVGYSLTTNPSELPSYQPSELITLAEGEKRFSKTEETDRLGDLVPFMVSIEPKADMAGTPQIKTVIEVTSNNADDIQLWTMFGGDETADPYFYDMVTEKKVFNGQMYPLEAKATGKIYAVGKAGTYTVRLTVTDGTSDAVVEEKTQTITIAEPQAITVTNVDVSVKQNGTAVTAVAPGGVYAVSADVTLSDNSKDSSGVKWEVTGNQSEATAIVEDKLTIGDGEAAKQLVVKATSKKDNTTFGTKTLDVVVESVDEEVTHSLELKFNTADVGKITVKAGNKTYEIMEDTTKQILDGDKVSLTAEATNSSYAFEKWASGETKATVSFTMEENKTYTANFKKTPTDPDSSRVTGVTLNEKVKTLVIGDSFPLTTAVSPSSAENKAVTWESSDPTVASVTNGTVKALKAGETTITVKTEDGEFTDTCEVKVNSSVTPPPSGDIAVTGVKLDALEKTLGVGNVFTLKATVSPSNATDKAVTWESSAPATVSVENGTVRALKAGKAIITVLTKDGGFAAECAVTVEAKQIVSPDDPADTGDKNADKAVDEISKTIVANQHEINEALANDTTLPNSSAEEKAVVNTLTDEMKKLADTKVDLSALGEDMLNNLDALIDVLPTIDVEITVKAEIVTTDTFSKVALGLTAAAEVSKDKAANKVELKLEVNKDKPELFTDKNAVLAFDMQLNKYVNDSTTGTKYTSNLSKPVLFQISLDKDTLAKIAAVDIYNDNRVCVGTAKMTVKDGVLSFWMPHFSKAVPTAKSVYSTGSPHYTSGGGGGGAFYGSTDGMPITATSGPNGSISPAGETKVEFGKDLTFTVTPDAGYVVDKVIVDGIREVQLTSGKYTFRSVDQPYTIEVTFKRGAGAAAEEAKPAAPAEPSTPAPNPQTGDGLFDHLFDSFLSFLL